MGLPGVKAGAFGLNVKALAFGFNVDLMVVLTGALSVVADVSFLSVVVEAPVAVVTVVVVVELVLGTVFWIFSSCSFCGCSFFSGWIAVDMEDDGTKGTGAEDLRSRNNCNLCAVMFFLVWML